MRIIPSSVDSFPLLPPKDTAASMSRGWSEATIRLHECSDSKAFARNFPIHIHDLILNRAMRGIAGMTKTDILSTPQ
jgi:hypothetical protein